MFNGWGLLFRVYLNSVISNGMVVVMIVVNDVLMVCMVIKNRLRYSVFW